VRARNAIRPNLVALDGVELADATRPRITSPIRLSGIARHVTTPADGGPGPSISPVNNVFMNHS